MSAIEHYYPGYTYAQWRALPSHQAARHIHSIFWQLRRAETCLGVACRMRDEISSAAFLSLEPVVSRAARRAIRGRALHAIAYALKALVLLRTRSAALV